MGEKIKLSFVNDGKLFVVPQMNVQRQEEILEELNKRENLAEDKFMREYNKVLVWKSLQIIDEKVSLEDIMNMHPEDYAFLVKLFWNKGKELVKGDDENFRDLK